MAPLLTLPEQIYREMVTHGLSLLPEEACGVLSGYPTEEGGWIAHRFHPVPNISVQRRHRFEMEPGRLIALLHEAAYRGGAVIGFFHTHPTTPPIPSEWDLATAWHTLPSHWILSLQRPSVPTMGVYRYVQDASGLLQAKTLPYRVLPDSPTL
ncbi:MULTISPECIES: M67 family metallopeptidase [Paenibacillus]|uniref:M67 family metallopeptidase n=1 Tax=Paenibacillus TaxID=44249 RepID=UPI0022B91689|nr:M67 family metallopeptidase [Paenibacillus caseinilyticus]MCZ8518020.1 M67 family metallopeptidase [Paenibacillus caseinilyticus]